ncbi:hypothetical protein GCM10012275_05260 [Longimycelium tulufanense]|uniref:Uncharacterized protein n=1 Tax=Longimycelium tulufanense TaxID=907463 RepID=A0A8J3C930_9PSEU|nr:hypothetical protein [Longimycelium tulufanense]GGM37059.1 hypothetical protein GCM10012275_05260 [Longimycelium tulufanense]
MIVKKLHDVGVRSEHAYMAAFGSIAFSFLTWLTSKKMENAPLSRADRWGIFVGEWAPTFFGLGLALARYEDDPSRAQRAGGFGGLRETMDETAEKVRS